MSDYIGRYRRRFRTLAAGAALGLVAALSASVPAASDVSPPVPDFTGGGCIVDIIAHTCPFSGSVVGGGEIVEWHWKGITGLGGVPLPNAQHVTARPAVVPQTVTVTLRVKDDGGRTGSVTRPVRLHISW